MREKSGKCFLYKERPHDASSFEETKLMVLSNYILWIDRS